MTKLQRFGPGTGYVVATFLSFPHPLGDTVIDLGLWVSWLSPAFLLLSLRGLAPGAAARRAFSLGLLAHAAILHWIYVVTVKYGGAPVWAGLVAPMGVALYPAGATALFGAGAAWLARRGAAGPLALAALWVVLDHARSFVFGGFTWATLGYGLHLDAPMLGLASITGVYGLSAVAALGGASLLLAVRPFSGRRNPRLAAFGIATVVALHGIGAAVAPPAPDGPTIRVAVLQGNIEQGVKWAPDYFERTLRIYETLAFQAAAEGAELIVWPETAIPGALTDPELALRFEVLAGATDARLVVGAAGVEWNDEGTVPRVFDSAYLFAPDGHQSARYDKVKLVPFGEFLPLRDLLGWIIKPLATGVTNRDLTPGPGPRAVESWGQPGDGPVLRLGVPICYELIFPDHVRRMSKDGAQALLGITNDAWYGATGAPYQFLAMTALRSAETGTWGARAANTGISALIDERGRVRDSTRIFERDFLVGDLPLRSPEQAPTFYAAHGDVFAWSCWIAIGGWALRARLLVKPARATNQAGEEDE
jgi:apolipoprotein N-acyltransferase